MAELDIRGLLEELVRDGVEFLIIGGVAVGYHGHVRATKDVDVVPAPNPANLKRLARVLTMRGGRKGLLVNNTELCEAEPRASVRFAGHNGKSSEASPRVGVGCGKGRKK